MNQYTLKIDGMMCSMCEAHINDAIRKEFVVRKVTSSHSKGQTIILTGQVLDEEKLKAAIEQTGYQLISIEKAAYKKKRLFGF